MRLFKKVNKETKKTIKAFGSNKGGCGDSYGNGPNPENEDLPKTNYTENQGK